jgi:DNA-binding NarL/FixJ family response regulator
MIRVLLADDQPLVRAGFAAILSTQPDIDVVGEAADGREALDLVQRLRPDVVLMDIRMPNLDGLQATRLIAADHDLDQVKVIMLTTFELDEYVFEALRIGASGFLVKHCEPADLTRAVRVTAAGDAMLSPSVTQRLVAEYARHAKEPAVVADPGTITDREREIVALVGQGLDNDEIARRLYLSPATVRTHVSRAMMKLDARNRAGLVVFAYESGLVRAGWSGTEPSR